MRFKIVGDSCCDFTPEEIQKEYVCSVPLTLIVGEREFIDDDSFKREDFFAALEETDGVPRSACPSPETYMESYKDADEIYVITISSKLSGSYNSAMVAKQMFLEENENVKIHVFDSKSAAAAQHLIYEKIETCALAGLSFEDTVATVTRYINSQTTMFVLEDLEVFIKNGRVPKVKGAVANVLNIKPVLKGNEGEIEQIDQARGMNKALNKLLWHIEKSNPDVTRKVEITCCESRERCLNVRKILMEQFGFTDVVVLEARGLSAMYENKGGVIISY